jgi:hypothetical protein
VFQVIIKSEGYADMVFDNSNSWRMHIKNSPVKGTHIHHSIHV